jgi:hypothetical protein
MVTVHSNIHKTCLEMNEMALFVVARRSCGHVGGVSNRLCWVDAPFHPLLQQLHMRLAFTSPCQQCLCVKQQPTCTADSLLVRDCILGTSW